MSSIRRASLADAVSQRILSLIEDGEYRAGDRLPSERRLGEQLGVGNGVEPEGKSLPQALPRRLPVRGGDPVKNTPGKYSSFLVYPQAPYAVNKHGILVG